MKSASAFRLANSWLRLALVTTLLAAALGACSR